MFAAAALLLLAIALEVGATTALPRTESFRQPGWTLLVLGSYALAIWLLSLVVQRIPVSIAYAIWAGLGTALVAVVGVVVLGEPWNAVKVGAIALIVVGVVALNLQVASH